VKSPTTLPGGSALPLRGGSEPGGFDVSFTVKRLAYAGMQIRRREHLVCGYAITVPALSPYRRQACA
jgi:hypothetical protein